MNSLPEAKLGPNKFAAQRAVAPQRTFRSRPVRAIFEAKAEKTSAPYGALAGAFERGGIEFIDENGGGPGLRLRRR